MVSPYPFKGGNISDYETFIGSAGTYNTRGSVSPSTEKNTTVDCSGKRNDEQVLPKYALASNALRKVASDGQSV